MNDIRAITIDLDDTLWELHPVIHRAERRLYAWLGEHYPRVTELHPPETMAEVRKQVFAEFPEQGHDYTFLRRTVLGRLGAAAEYGGHLVDEAMEVFDTERNNVEIFPEVRPALERLRRHYVLVAVTNGNACLERIGIHDLFDHFVSARIAGAAKPSSKIFEVAVTAGGAAPHQTLHVGDHPEFDVQGARDAGLPAVWVNRNDSEWPDGLSQPDGVVNHVGELAALLDAAKL